MSSSFPYDSDTDHHHGGATFNGGRGSNGSSRGSSGSGGSGGSSNGEGGGGRENDDKRKSGGGRGDGDGRHKHANGGGGDPSGGHDSMDEPEEEVDNEYYNFMHVSRTATPEEITAAYKKLSRLYHPDKHMEDKKKQAELMFAKLKNAYEVLSNPHKRAIYDCLGKKGLEEPGLEIVQRTRTPQEIREQYERLAKEAAERRLQRRSNPTSRLQVSVNAKDLFQRGDDDDDDEDLAAAVVTIPSISVSEISFNQTIELPLTNTDNLTLSGNVSTRNGDGSGSVGCNYRHVSSEKSWHEFSTSIGSGPSFGSRLYRKLSTNTFVNMSGSLQLTSHGIVPSFSTTLGNNLSKNTVGYLTYSTDWCFRAEDAEYLLSQEQSGMSTMIVRDGEKFHMSASFQLGIPYTYFMASITRKFDVNKKKDTKVKHEPIRLRGTVKVGTFGAVLEYGIERRLTPHSNLGAVMSVGIPFGVTLRVKFTRFTQTYTFPLHLSDELMMQPIFYGTVGPLLTWYTFKKLVLDPWEANKKKEEKENLKEANLVRVAAARKEALASVELMRERFNRIRQEEFQRRGFVVVFALYGKIMDETNDELVVDIDEILGQQQSQSSSPEKTEFTDLSGEAASHYVSEVYTPPTLDKSREMIDVTVPVQCLVDNSRLTFFEGNHTKSELAGFYDPCALLHDEQKHLLVRYLYQGLLHQVVIADDEAAKLPKNTHRL